MSNWHMLLMVFNFFLLSIRIPFNRYECVEGENRVSGRIPARNENPPAVILEQKPFEKECRKMNSALWSKGLFNEEELYAK